jgi:hypothetical protein
MRKSIAAALMAALSTATLIVAMSAPAGAADTTTVFTLTGAGLDLTAPSSANIGSATTGSASISGQLGPVTVTDSRGAAGASWTSTVTGSDFSTGGGSPPETITNINVLYFSGPATSTTGAGNFTPGQPTPASAVIINVPRTAFSLNGGNGNNSATWNPNLIINLPSAAVSGLYSGTVTHSVS